MRVRRTTAMRTDSELEILDSIVAAVAVLVMTLLTAHERPAKMAGHDETVLQEIAGVETRHLGELIPSPYEYIATDCLATPTLPTGVKSSASLAQWATLYVSPLKGSKDCGVRYAIGQSELDARFASEIAFADLNILRG